jgi:beta-galactosidase/beta-glucuronidase
VPTPDIDAQRLSVVVDVANAAHGDIVEVAIKDAGKTVAIVKVAAGQQIDIPVLDMKLWSPETPFLYDLETSLYANGKLQDKVTGYAAMRKISVKPDKNDILRLQLNNETYFQLGPLDQGWWPDGLYTAPTDEALLYDIQKTKDFGFNMIRKVIKMEEDRLRQANRELIGN